MTDELVAWLRLTLTPGVSGSAQRKLLRAFGTPEAIFTVGYSGVASVVGGKIASLLQANEDETAVSKTRDWLAGNPYNHVLTLADAAYPQQLLSIADPPCVLYVSGNSAVLNNETISVVGSRNATPQGLKTAHEFARELASHGYGISSGLALGIDAAAHRGALEAEGVTTVAFVGTGIDCVYPFRHQTLAETIISRGAIVSEFPLGTPPAAANFPRRNRLIAGISRGVLVVEASTESGSLITARFAAEQGREVFAIPGSIHSPFSRGCHRLIKEGAKLVETTQDILEELGRTRPYTTRRLPQQTKTVKGATSSHTAGTTESPKEKALLLAMGAAPCNLDDISRRTGESADNLLQQLLKLELEGRVVSLPGNQYQCIV